MPKYQPLNDHILIKALKDNEVSKAGIILPDTIDKEKPEKGEVVAMGPGKLLDNGQRAPMSVKIGDNVIFKKYAPDEIPGVRVDHHRARRRAQGTRRGQRPHHHRRHPRLARRLDRRRRRRRHRPA